MSVLCVPPSLRYDFTGIGPYLFVCCIALFLTGLVLMIMSACGLHFKWAHIIYAGLGVLLFSIYLVYDTQLIVRTKHNMDGAMEHSTAQTALTACGVRRRA